MISKSLIKAFPQEKRVPANENFLRVSEFYYDTIQGEGATMGSPAAFLRLQGCPMGCVFCDTTEVWRKGNPYTNAELLHMMRTSGLEDKLRKGQHLVITGGSPLSQQDKLRRFLLDMESFFDFLPYLEIENECTIMPEGVVGGLIDCWNNSPKLTDSGVPFEKRYIPEVIKFTGELRNSWFKFVVSKEEDWSEIDVAFLMPELIRRDQIILMPQGANREELEKNIPIAVEMAIENNVLFTTRQHIVMWNKTVGV
jgi:7-carboxy-7-deazaguanine synthase